MEYYKEQGKEILFPLDSEDYEKFIASIDCTLLILTVSDDRVTTHESAVRLQKELGSNCQIILHEGDHLTGFQVDYDNKGFGGWFPFVRNPFSVCKKIN